jgi:hypothetical protein
VRLGEGLATSARNVPHVSKLEKHEDKVRCCTAEEEEEEEKTSKKKKKKKRRGVRRRRKRRRTKKGRERVLQASRIAGYGKKKFQSC